MAKISKEEYWFLKGLNDGWKWIARDSNTSLWVYEKEPRKHEDCWGDSMGTCEMIDSPLFQFIQWEDEEPWNIRELIEGYLDDEYGYFNMNLSREFEEFIETESEEAEVKKDIELLKDEVAIVLREVFNNHALDYVKYIEVKRQLEALLDQLDESEVLSQEITEENGMSESEWAEVINRYKWHLEQENYVVIEKPTIPKFVAESLSGKEEYLLHELLDNILFYDDYNELAGWLYDNDEDVNREREHSLVLARIYGHKLEKEQEFYALVKGHEKIGSDDKYWNYCIKDESLDIGDNKVHADVLTEYVLSATKDEWENLGVNDDNADFVLVEELE